MYKKYYEIKIYLREIIAFFAGLAGVSNTAQEKQTWKTNKMFEEIFLINSLASFYVYKN